MTARSSDSDFKADAVDLKGGTVRTETVGVDYDDNSKGERERALHHHLDERAAALRIARDADPGPSWNDWRGIKLFLIILVTCMCSGDTGFDATIMSAVNSMTQFQDYFHLEGEAAGTGIIFGIYTVGGISAFFFQSVLTDRIGRRYTMFVGNAILITGAFVNGFAHSMHQLLAGRFIVGLGCGLAANAATCYLSEITSPWNRGRALGLFNSFYYVGQLLASGLSIPLGRMASNWSWRTPFLLQCMLATINFCLVLFLPESPRWLYSRGHRERAVKILANLHSKTNDINSPLVQLEIAEFEEAISLDGADKRFWDFRPLFNTRGARYRFFMVAIVNCWGQLSGNGLITYFLPVLLKLAGITSPDRQRLLNFVNSITSFTGALTGTALVDKVGRRTLMLSATISCTLGMAIVAGLLSDAGEQSPMRANVGITFIFLFMVFFSFGWTPLQALYPSECLPYEVRAKGLALGTWVSAMSSMINTFGLPSALQTLGWKTYLVFMCWDVVGFATVYTWVVETKQLSLEELDDVFASRNPKKTSFALAKVAKERARAERMMAAGIGA